LVKTKLSICMMVKDEEKNLKRCLESLKPLLLREDVELIIVDTGSKDKTIEIAKNYTTRIYFKEWKHDFSEMRNYTISLASGDWIFILDADEEVENPENVIEEIKKAEKKQANTICLTVKNLTQEDDKKNYVINISPRIFKKNYIKYWGRVHNQPIYHEPIYYSDIAIYHYGYILLDTRLMEYKYKRTVTLLLNELEKDPTNVYYRYQLGVSYSMYGKLKEASIEFEKAYNLLRTQNSETKKRFLVLYSLYAKTLLGLGLYDMAREIAEEGINFNSDYIDLYYIAGQSLYMVGRRKEAVEYFKRYLDFFAKNEKPRVLNDPSLAFYYVNDYYIDQAISYILQYYLDANNFNEVKKYIDSFRDINSRLKHYVLMYLELREYKKLKEFYVQCKQKEKIAEFIEKFIVELKLDEDERNKLYEEFATISDLYGRYAELWIKSIDATEIINYIFRYGEIKNLSAFYFKALFCCLGRKEFLINKLKEIDILTLRKKIAEALAAKFIDFEDVINLLEVIKKEKADIDILTRYIALALLVLLNFPRQSDERLYEIFLNYTENGILLMNRLYKNEEIKEKYRYFLSDEEKYFALMYMIYLSLQEKRMDKSIKYLREAIATMPKLVKHLKRFSKDILGVDV